ncbi:MAG TPA: hypothetical protein DCG75_01950 [Bacteroidales bacterium]|nr:hypothetical protein [Bacteroidales bacterium]
MTFRRTVLKQELVKKLYPDSISIKSAMQQLRNEIDLCPQLKEKIGQAGHLRKHTYNFEQLNLILEHFSLSLEDYNLL